MQAPAAGWTGKAPPGAGGAGGAGVALDEAMTAVGGVAPSGERPNAKANTVAPPQNKAAVMPLLFATNSTVVALHGVRRAPLRLEEDSKTSRRILEGHFRTHIRRGQSGLRVPDVRVFQRGDEVG